VTLGGAPDDVGDLPDARWHRPERGLLRLRLAVATVAVGVPVLVAVVLVGLLDGVPQAVATLLAGSAALALVLAVVDRRWRAWGWYEREDDLLVRRGVLVRRVSVVPYGRMQFVDVVSGPLERRFGLATVTLHTAARATQAFVPGLSTSEAARLRDHLAALGEARQAGL
jgi:membrane protein YdbS with pleckstrin-like domain